MRKMRTERSIGSRRAIESLAEDRRFNAGVTKHVEQWLSLLNEKR